MIRISRLADYSILIMTALAKTPMCRMSAVDLTRETHVSLPTVSKLLKKLLEAGLVSSHRGASGGYTLSKPVNTISVANIIVAIDGPISITDCTHPAHHCDKAPACDTKGNWQVVNRAIEAALQDVSLLAMCQPLQYLPLTLKGIKIESKI